MLGGMGLQRGVAQRVSSRWRGGQPQLDCRHCEVPIPAKPCRVGPIDGVQLGELLGRGAFGALLHSFQMPLCMGMACGSSGPAAGAPRAAAACCATPSSPAAAARRRLNDGASPALPGCCRQGVPRSLEGSHRSRESDRPPRAGGGWGNKCSAGSCGEGHSGVAALLPEPQRLQLPLVASKPWGPPRPFSRRAKLHCSWL